LQADTCRTMGKNTEQATAKQKMRMLHALEITCGNAAKAARLAKISVRTHFRWTKEDYEYANEVINVKAICYNEIKDTLLELAMKQAKKGDSAVLNQLLRIFFKDVPEDMKYVTRVRRPPPISKTIRYVDEPLDWKLEDYKEAQEQNPIGWAKRMEQMGNGTRAG